MNKTIEEAATRYADENFNRHIETIQNCPWPEWEESYAKAFEAGANFSLSHQWRSVEDELPEDGETVLTLSSCGHVLAYYSKQDEMWFAYGNYGDISPTHFMYIPSLNPEQR